MLPNSLESRESAPVIRPHLRRFGRVQMKLPALVAASALALGQAIALAQCPPSAYGPPPPPPPPPYAPVGGGQGGYDGPVDGAPAPAFPGGTTPAPGTSGGPATGGRTTGGPAAGGNPSAGGSNSGGTTPAPGRGGGPARAALPRRPKAVSPSLGLEPWWSHVGREALIEAMTPESISIDYSTYFGEGTQSQDRRALGSRVLDQKVLPSLRKALTHAVPERRAAAAEALARTGRAEAVPALLGLLKDADARVRRSAVLGLGLCGQAQTFDVLASILEATPAAASVFGIASPSQIEVGLRERAALALGLQNEPRSLGVLVRNLEAEGLRNPHLGAACVAGLALSGRSGATGALTKLAMSNAAPEELRAVAVAALGGVDDRGPVVQRFLQVAAFDKSARVSRAAVGALGRLVGIRDTDSIAALKKVADQSTDAVAKSLALFALAAAPSEASGKSLMEAASGNGPVAGLAPPALALHPRDNAFELEARTELRKLAEQASSTGVRAAAALGLGALREGDDMPILPKVVETSSHEAVRMAAVRSLGLLRDRAGAEDVYQVFDQDKDESVRAAGAFALAQIFKDHAVSLLVGRLDKTEDLRWAMELGRALAETGSPLAADALAQRVAAAP